MRRTISACSELAKRTVCCLQHLTSLPLKTEHVLRACKATPVLNSNKSSGTLACLFVDGGWGSGADVNTVLCVINLFLLTRQIAVHLSWLYSDGLYAFEQKPKMHTSPYFRRLEDRARWETGTVTGPILFFSINSFSFSLMSCVNFNPSKFGMDSFRFLAMVDDRKGKTLECHRIGIIYMIL